MNNDLLFPILPREGKVTPVHEEFRIEQIQKGHNLRAINEKEDEVRAEDREAREKSKQKKKKFAQPEAENEAENTDPENAVTTDKHGRKHVDCYI